MSNSSKLTVNKIFREYCNEYMKNYYTTNYEKKIIRAIISCRTEELGGRVEKCDHCVVPGGGYQNNNNKWINAPQNYLAPVDVLKAKFKYLFLMGLKKLYKNNDLYLNGTEYDNPKKFQMLIDKLFKKEWVIYIKETFKNSDSVIEYLGRYTHRIAISNYRIKRVENGRVYFEYRDYKDNNKKKIYDLTIFSFIRHFLLHILPYRFVRIRYYGLLSHRNKKKSIDACYEYYNEKKKKEISLKSWQDVYLKVIGVDVTKCVRCGIGRMTIKEVIIGGWYRAPPGKRA